VRQKKLATRNRNANANANWETASQPGDDIAERLLDIAAAVIWLLPVLGDKPGGKNLVNQLERCGPGGGANYEEARGAGWRSELRGGAGGREPGRLRADFVHKVRIALKEVRETRYWLRLILRAKLVDRPHELRPLVDECGELIAILTASARTARRRAATRK